jgi:preprotein translocase subunit SecA
MAASKQSKQEKPVIMESEQSTQVQTVEKTDKTTAISSQNKVTKGRSRVKKLLDNLVGERKELGKYSVVVKKVEEFDEKMKSLSDDELRAKTIEFREKLKGLKDKEMEKKLSEILPEAFAVVREGAWRAIGQKHFPVQLIGGMVLNDGRVAEMRTGEGKTLVATLSIYLNSLPEQNQVHLVTVNDYLARRDASWMGRIYNFLGLSVGVIQNQASFYFKLGAQADAQSDKKREIGRVETFEDGEQDDSRAVLDVENLVHCDRKRAYWDDELNQPVDIVYGVNSEFGFDYLRDNMANTPDEVVQKAGHCVAVVDEVDSILIDEARTPLIISSQDADSSARYRQFADLVKKLNPEVDYTVDEKRRIATLTEFGIEKVERMLNIVSLYESPENVVLIHHLDQALKAFTLFRREKEYVVRDGEIVIVDEFTGRLMFGRRYNQGLHQALEAKESLSVQSESKTVATVTFQNYFRLYKKLSGMTGTAATEAEELFKIYKLVVVTIPTNRPMIRKDFVDKIFKSEAGKFTAIARDIKVIHETGQPILIGTTSIEKNLELSR